MVAGQALVANLQNDRVFHSQGRPINRPWHDNISGIDGIDLVSGTDAAAR